MSIDEIRKKAQLRKAQFKRNGETVADWADQHNYRRTDVYRVLNGMTPCSRGTFHEIAVRLGIKPAPETPHPGQS